MTEIDFTEYVENRKIFYDKLSKFYIEPENISTGIILSKSFFERINVEFEDFSKEEKQMFDSLNLKALLIKIILIL